MDPEAALQKIGTGTVVILLGVGAASVLEYVLKAILTVSSALKRTGSSRSRWRLYRCLRLFRWSASTL